MTVWQTIKRNAVDLAHERSRVHGKITVASIYKETEVILAAAYAGKKDQMNTDLT